MSSNFIKVVKNKFVNLPYPIGKLISIVPYRFRPVVGKVYKQRKEDIYTFSKLSELEKQAFVFSRVKKIALYAYENISFYNSYYKACGFNPNDLNDFSDLEKIPVITKAILQKYSITQRVSNDETGYIENTGGSSGKPFELMIQPSSVGHEWAHMHVIWAKVGFKVSDLRIVFSGRSNIKNVIEYDSARHQLNVDTYAGWNSVADKLFLIFDSFNPSYIHGYPSAIFDFILWLQSNSHPLLHKLKHNIRGLLLGSEYPNPILRQKVEELLCCDSVSWYGHTERCVLAYEKFEKQKYYPFQTYGFTESIEVENSLQLVATSYYNFKHPLIRYNTEDIIEGEKEKSLLLESFLVSHGRCGEYIVDSKGNKVFLTAFIFGRHHKLFDYSSFIQVKQEQPGQAIVYYVLRKTNVDQIEPKNLFDSKNINLDITFCELKEPIKTVSGKTPLLVS